MSVIWAAVELADTNVVYKNLLNGFFVRLDALSEDTVGWQWMWPAGYDAQANMEDLPWQKGGRSPDDAQALSDADRSLYGYVAISSLNKIVQSSAKKMGTYIPK